MYRPVSMPKKKMARYPCVSIRYVSATVTTNVNKDNLTWKTDQPLFVLRQETDTRSIEGPRL
jgi:hypothetical protein